MLQQYTFPVFELSGAKTQFYGIFCISWWLLSFNFYFLRECFINLHVQREDNLILFLIMIKSIVGIVLLMVLVAGTKFTLSLQSYEKQCFFQILQSQQKYAVDLAPQGSGNYEVEVSNMIEGKWNSVHFKQTKSPYEHVSIHKLAPTQSTYSYCVRNIHGEKQKFNVSIQSGLQLMEFELLPAKTDAQNLERQLNWLEKEKSKLFESLDRMQSLRATSEGLTNMMSTKMVGFAIVGLVAIIVVNVLFYRELKKTFKERKLI